MKKLIVGVLCALSLFGSMFALGACDDRTDTITAVCPLDKDYFTLPFKPDDAWTYGAGCRFSVKYTLQEMKDLIDAMQIEKGSVSTAIYGNYMKVEVSDTAYSEYSEEKTHFYMITLVKAFEKSYSYDFSTPYMCVSDKHGDSVDAVIPRYFFDADEIETLANQWYFKPNEMYLVNATMEDFAEFYQKLKLFSVTIEENDMIITCKEPDYMERSSYGKSFIITFEPREDGLYVSYSPNRWAR